MIDIHSETKKEGRVFEIRIVPDAEFGFLHGKGGLIVGKMTVKKLFGFWDHQKYFINLVFKEHLKYQSDPKRGACFLLCDGVASERPFVVAAGTWFFCQ